VDVPAARRDDEDLRRLLVACHLPGPLCNRQPARELGETARPLSHDSQVRFSAQDPIANPLPLRRALRVQLEPRPLTGRGKANVG
jgi:hypothetical protein